MITHYFRSYPQSSAGRSAASFRAFTWPASAKRGIEPSSRFRTPDTSLWPPRSAATEAVTHVKPVVYRGVMPFRAQFRLEFQSLSSKCRKSASWNDIRTNGHSFSQPASRTRTRAWSKTLHRSISLFLNNLETASREQNAPFGSVNGSEIATKTSSFVGLLWR